MQTSSVFHLISNLTQQEGVPCVLIGGFAVNYYRVTRSTADIDFLVTKEGLAKIAGQLERAGYAKARTDENFAQFESDQVSLIDIDFVFVDQETLEKIIKEGQRMIIAGQVFMVPSILHLIALKLHAVKGDPKNRLLKDFPDIVRLIKTNGIDHKDPEFRSLCLKYGSQDIYNRIDEALR